MKYCTHAFLVGLDHELPSDRAVAYSGGSPIIGCNHLVCSDCDAVVRYADGRVTTSNYPPPRAANEALYDSSDPGSSSGLNAFPAHRRSRAYFCRCNWADVHLGGCKSVGSIDPPWGCGGHAPGLVQARDIPVAEARSQGVPAAVPAAPTGPKIRIFYAGGVNPEFATVSELRDSLLASYPAADFFRAPVVDKGGENLVPAWGWVIKLIRMRSDWWPAIGIALQHAVTDGGELARTAFADLLAEFRDSLVLLPWTADVAAAMPDVRARGSGTGWGVPDLRLETLVRDQTKYVDHLKATSDEVSLLGYGKRGKLIEGRLTSEADLRALLEETAKAGQFPDGDKGPWSWLGFELRTHEDWLRSAFVRVAATIDAADEPLVFALLDGVSEEQDLWRLEPLLAGWDANPPAWAKTAANHKPKGWRRTIRSSHWPDVQTLGDVAQSALWRAGGQVATPPVVDLPQLFG